MRGEVTPTPIPPLEIQFWHGQNQSQQAALDKLIERFNATHPDIQVTATYQGAYGDVAKQVLATARAPDLALAYQDEIARLVKAGAVFPLDDLIKDSEIGFNASDLRDIFPAFIDRYPQLGGKVADPSASSGQAPAIPSGVYGIGFYRSMQVMYYSADLLKAAGFSKPPETWDDFLKVCAAVTKSPDVFCYVMDASAYDWATWVWSRGGALLSADGKTVAFDQKPGLDALTFLGDLFAKKYAIVASRAFQEPGDFALGKVAFTFDTTMGLPVYDKAIKSAAKPINWGIAPLPRTTREPVVALYGPSLAILKTTPERQRAAFVFLKWLLDKEQNAEWAQATGYFPARASSKAALAEFIKARPQYGQAFDLLRYGRGEPTVAAWGTLRGFVGEMLMQVATGEAKPVDALRDAARKANVVLAGQ